MRGHMRPFRTLTLAAAAAAGLTLALAPFGRRGGQSLAAVGAAGEDVSAAPQLRGVPELPQEYAAALNDGWKQVDGLNNRVTNRGLVKNFGKEAEAILRKAVGRARASGGDARSLEQMLDAPLKALFLQQMQIVLVDSIDRYDIEMSRRPNPLEAALAAEAHFDKVASGLKRPNSDWSVDAHKQELLARVEKDYGRDWKLLSEQGNQGMGKQITVEVIRKLQQQSSAVQREVETRGAFPWNIKWQYFLERSPLGFRGQYSQGRSIVELLLMPSPDPRQKNNILNKIGPLNLAVAFDALM
mmetsp:Transcript_2692/g.10494  ORF Transcript_2692/g.10494 Transcript_2692/m.10494 type:complete len:299 (-) Transcript_2692:52-948(-)